MSLELDHLLQPISESRPCGIDCSFSNEFHAIKKAKTKDDPLLEQGDWVSEQKKADWAFIHAKSTELLTEKTKDLRLLTWLLEAWPHLYGFDGIAKALELTHRSLNVYWDLLHPEIEDGDLDQRIGLLQGFINLLPALLKGISVVSTPAAYTLSDYDSMRHHQNQRLKMNAKDELNEETANYLEQFEQALFNTSKSVQYQNFQQFLDIINQWQLLKETLDSLMGLDAPSFASIDSQIETIHMTIKKIYKADAFYSSSAESANTASEPVNHADFSANHAVQHMNHQQSFQPQLQNHLANRAQAMLVLQEIADYFQANEPHSPVSYLLQKTIKWSHMPLHEWLAQVLKNEKPLETVHELLGVQANTHDSNNETDSNW
ncbi:MULTISPECIES: type VI secretion system protein TssA [Acinetobacter]|jgi:type VI secretion system protein ImpA|uniref:Type VI secretion system protein TssA n=1 Tax=Acinetobacter entericus TaxID=2989714 RepID=A0ABT3NLN8_9GAMM|nr:MULTISPECIES: type VI secretion system protein TssA [Acinetobacter]MCW8040442.1 type VI secretion system protein TssA [Acinetobacter entericus]TCB76954.1 type VI secretion system protein TssA [Acinetobacter sp. ANC 4177]